MAADSGGWLCFEDEAGQGLRPPKGRTWGRCGATPVVAVCAKGSGRVSLAGLMCSRPGHDPRLIYRTIVHHGRKDEPKGFTEADYAQLLDAAHQQLGGPIVVVWDNLNAHVSTRMRRYIAARTWLTVFQLPAYAPELNPTEGVWSHLKSGLANFASRTIDDVAGLVKTRLKRMQYRPSLLTGITARTGLDFNPP
jgi:putative transposase